VTQTADAAIDDRHEAFGGPNGLLGPSLEAHEEIAGGRRRVYRNGHIYVRTPREAIAFEAPSEQGQAEAFSIRREGARVRVEVDTTGHPKDATVGVGSIVDAGRGEALGVAVSLGLPRPFVILDRRA
jgi:hypothetical protein